METMYHLSQTDEDRLPVVDESDRLLGSGTRREIHLRRLRHRAVHIVIVNPRGEILLQQRSDAKDSFPGWWDISVGGHVDFGETYDEAARRELREEMGVEAPHREVSRRDACAETGWEFLRIYECLYDGATTPAPTEISAVRWVNAEDLLSRGHSDASLPDWCVTPSGLASIRLWAAGRG